MKSISMQIIKSIFDMFIGCFKQVKGLSKTDKPWQEWLIFILFTALTFFVLWVSFQWSIDIIMGANQIMPEVIHK